MNLNRMKQLAGMSPLHEQNNNDQIQVKKVSKPSKASNKDGEYFITKGDKIYIGGSKENPNWIKKDSMIHSSDWEGGVLMSKQQADKKAQELGGQVNEAEDESEFDQQSYERTVRDFQYHMGQGNKLDALQAAKNAGWTQQDVQEQLVKWLTRSNKEQKVFQSLDT